MPGEVTLEDVEFIVNSESYSLDVIRDNLSYDTLCKDKEEIRKSRQRLTKALEMLDALIQERELSSLSAARQ